MNKEEIEKKLLEQEIPLSEEEQSVIGQELQSPDYIYFRSDTDNFIVPKTYNEESTYSLIKQRIQGKKNRTILYLSAAATIAILVVSLAWLQFDRNRMIRIETGYGETRIVELSDGSLINLNALTSLTYPKHLSKKERIVELSGEAQLEVSKDSNRPFKVITDNLQVEVLGTIFNVKAYPEDETIETGLLEGSVKLSYANGRTCILTPGQTEIYHKATFLAQMVEKDFPVWTKELLKFENTPLESILQTLSRQYQVEFIIENDKELLKITGTFQTSQSLDEIMDILKEAGNFNYRKEGKQIVIE